jgi:hypothetical protein
MTLFFGSKWGIKIYELWVQKYSPTIYIFKYAVSIAMFHIIKREK